MHSVSKPITTCRILIKDIFAMFFLLSKTVLGDSESSVLLSPQLKRTEAPRITSIFELINKAMET